MSCEICPCCVVVNVCAICWFLFQSWLTHRCVDVCLYVCRVRVCVRRDGSFYLCVELCVFGVLVGVLDCHCVGVVSVCRANVHVCGVCCVLRMCVCIFCIQVTFRVFKFQDLVFFGNVLGSKGGGAWCVCVCACSV